MAQKNDWKAAEPILLEAIRCGRASGNLYNVMVAYHILSRFHSFQGNLVRAKAILHEALEVAAQHGQQPIPALGVIYIALGALLVEPEQFEQAESYLQRGEELTKACFQLEVLLYGWQAQAKLYAAHGNLEQAFAVLARGEVWLKQVTLPEDLRQELLRVLQQQHESLQVEGENERLSEPQPLKQSLIEPLSDRELEILRLVHQGLSNSEIAETLIVTVGTVKKHLNNIFGKLGAGSRTQALVRAREARLL